MMVPEEDKLLYPIVTKGNFESFTNKYVFVSNMRWGDDAKFIYLEMPKNENEFKIFTKNIYGVELGVDCKAYPKGWFGTLHKCRHFCEYEITGMKRGEYNDMPIMKLWRKKYEFPPLAILLNSCFGKLHCGGIGYYGQTYCNKATWNRVKNWDKFNDAKVIKGIIETHNNMVKDFGYNPLLK